MAQSSKERVGAMSRRHYLPAWAQKSRQAEIGGIRSVVGGDLGEHKNANLLDHPDGCVTDAKLATDNKIGSLSALLTSATSSVVAAINEIVGAIGTFLTGTLATGRIPYASGSGALSDSRAEQVSGGGMKITGNIGDSQPTLHVVRTYADVGSGVAHEVLLNHSGELVRLKVAGVSVLAINEAAITPGVPVQQQPEVTTAGSTIDAGSQIVEVAGTGVITLPLIADYPMYAILTIVGDATLGPGATLTPAPSTGDAYAVAPAALAAPYAYVRQYHNGAVWVVCG